MPFNSKLSLPLIFLALTAGLSRPSFAGSSVPQGNLPSGIPTGNSQDTGNDSASRPSYRHAYYLFQTGVVAGCEDCYVPLLITQTPLDEIAKQKENADCVWITTYERDSIWQMNGTVSVEPGNIEAPRRVLHFNGHSYRYQEITAGEVLKLLEKPHGAIPISRPYLPDKSSPGSAPGDLISDFRMIFRMRERRQDPAPMEKSGGPVAGGVLLSELTVLGDGTVRYRIASGCFGRLKWDWKSQCPTGANSSKVFQGKLSSNELMELKAFLERQDVKDISDFMNAAPIFDDFDIEIPREQRSQHIQVLAFLPNHVELQQHPALALLVCEAKKIEGVASNSPGTPDWCRNFLPLK